MERAVAMQRRQLRRRGVVRRVQRWLLVRRLTDPERHVRDAIACYSRDAIVDAIAIFSGKRTAATLPDGVDARYLLGIVAISTIATRPSPSPRR